MKIIDFHTHPFEAKQSALCEHYDYLGLSKEKAVDKLKAMGISHICGSVITQNDYFDKDMSIWDRLKARNNTALELADFYNGFYIPGFHVHPDYVKESCEEIERMSKLGVKLIGELVPYIDGWKDYSRKEFDEILDTAKEYNMIVSFHTDAGTDDDEIDKMVKKHPKVTFVGAHPGEYRFFIRHLERMKMSGNYYLDLSCSGIMRYGMLKRCVEAFGNERFLFGSDFPIFDPSIYIGGIMYNKDLSDSDKEHILYKNAEKLLNL